jgi:hypothetical protein
MGDGRVVLAEISITANRERERGKEDRHRDDD